MPQKPVNIYKTEDSARNEAIAQERGKEAAMTLPRWVPAVAVAVGVIVALIVVLWGLIGGGLFYTAPK